MKFKSFEILCLCLYNIVILVYGKFVFALKDFIAFLFYTNVFFVLELQILMFCCDYKKHAKTNRIHEIYRYTRFLSIYTYKL